MQWARNIRAQPHFTKPPKWCAMPASNAGMYFRPLDLNGADMRTPSGHEVYAMGAEYPSPAALYEAAKMVRDAGFKRWDVFSPFRSEWSGHENAVRSRSLCNGRGISEPSRTLRSRQNGARCRLQTLGCIFAL